MVNEGIGGHCDPMENSSFILHFVCFTFTFFLFYILCLPPDPRKKAYIEILHMHTIYILILRPTNWKNPGYAEIVI